MFKPWHGKKKCEDEIDKDFKKWKKNKLVKQCPKCKMWTEKNEGCNHMTCVECKYQWCWLCGGKYTDGHFEVGGGCAGLQYFDNKLTNNCLFLIIYKLLIFILQFLLMVIGFLPVTSCVIFFKINDSSYNNECLMNMYFCFGIFFWNIPYFIFGCGISCLINISSFLYWPLQEKILRRYLDIVEL